jgi:hypothetical protein
VSVPRTDADGGPARGQGRYLDIAQTIADLLVEYLVERVVGWQ